MKTRAVNLTGLPVQSRNQLQQTVRELQLRENVSSLFAVQKPYADGDTTPDVANASLMIITNTAATTISDFRFGVLGQVLVLIFNDANTTINRNNCYLSGGVNFTSSQADVLTLIKGTRYWHEVSRSINA